MKNGKVPVGACAWTNAGNMSCKFVIHAVGPIYYHNSKEINENLLAACIINILECAKKLKAKSVSIPAISSGVFGFPISSCARILQ